jgi:hypothetical protein
MSMIEVYRYKFDASVPIEDIEASLLLALLSVESIHGESQVRLDAAHFLDAETHTCTVDANTDVGRDLNRLFTGFVRREFGEDMFQVKRMDAAAAGEPAGAAA